MSIRRGRYRASMDIERGFEIDDPTAFVPWGIGEGDLADRLPHTVRRIADGYHTADCTALGGLLVTAGFHFRPRQDGVLHRVELFRGETLDLGTSYARFQDHLERTFGAPHRTGPGSGAYPHHEWRFGEVTIWHKVTARFSTEEQIVLDRTDAG